MISQSNMSISTPVKMTGGRHMTFEQICIKTGVFWCKAELEYEEGVGSVEQLRTFIDLCW